MKQHRKFNTEYLFPPLFILLTFALFWPALRVFFSLDDLNFLLRATGLEDHSLRVSRIISTRFFFGAAWNLFGARPWPYHLVAFIVHATSAWILYLVALRLNLKKYSACAASILFTVTPIAFHPLYWISGIQEVSATFFALLAVYFFLGKGNKTIVFSLVAAGISLFCKETSFLLLPVLALIMPGSSRRRWILGVGGLLLGISILAVSGKFVPRASGDPYETIFGMNIIWNLLTYSAWLIRLWDFYSDRVPVYNSDLAMWGMVLPLALGCTACFFKKFRRPFLQATLLFLALLAPVLPLVRHSYLYYLYLPLIPFWLLTGGLLGKISWRTAAGAILALYASYSLINMTQHRMAEIADGVLTDPILRYATITESAVRTFRATGEIRQGDYLFIIHRSEDSIDLTGGQGRSSENQIKQTTMFENALLGGRGLKLFFPQIQNVFIEYAADYIRGWQNMHIYWLSNVGMKYMGYGKEGRWNVIKASMKSGHYLRAQREIDIMLDLQPNDPLMIFLLGTIALQQGNEAKLESILSILENMAGMENHPGSATECFNSLKKATDQR